MFCVVVVLDVFLVIASCSCFIDAMYSLLYLRIIIIISIFLFSLHCAYFLHVAFFSVFFFPLFFWFGFVLLFAFYTQTSGGLSLSAHGQELMER